MSPDPAALAAGLLGGPPGRLVAIGGGGNSRVFRVERGGTAVALKLYPPRDDDPRDRLGQEWAALSFLDRHGIAGPPRPLAIDRPRGAALYSWLDGEPVRRPDDTDIDQLADFLLALLPLRRAEGATELVPASAACLHPGAAPAQAAERLARLRAIAAAPAELTDHLDTAVAPLLRDLTARCDQAGLTLPADAAILSPSDFGFHNALRHQGRARFLDFEYFGWDDPAKTLADAMLHPGSGLAPAQARRLRLRVEPVLAAEDATFSRRFALLYPVFVVVWSLIVLNEFLPEIWAQRRRAGLDRPWAEVAAEQLSKSRHLLQRITPP